MVQSGDPNPSEYGATKQSSSELLPPSKPTTVGWNILRRKTDPAYKGYALSFKYLGGRGYYITLYAQTDVSRWEWVEHIEKQQRLICDRSSIFAKAIVCEKYFMGSNKVNCAVAFGIEPLNGADDSWRPKISIWHR